MDSYDVRFWDTRKLGTGTAARYRVRWAVDGREHCKSFKARPLADGFLDGLKDAVRDRRPFNPRTGLPEAETTEGEMTTWYQHARAYAEAKALINQAAGVDRLDYHLDQELESLTRIAGSGDFAAAWGGIASLQLGLPAVWTEARRRGHELADVVRWMSSGPAALAGLVRLALETRRAAAILADFLERYTRVAAKVAAAKT